MPPGSIYNCGPTSQTASIDRRPSLIARCASQADVSLAVKLARAEKMPVSVRGGGHGVAGTAVCDGGLMIDLSLLKDLRVDPLTREAIAAPGVLWGEFESWGTGKTRRMTT